MFTRFQAAMYFSMQPVTHADSELEREEPGVATHFSKQVDLRFCTPGWSAHASSCVGGSVKIEAPRPGAATREARETYVHKLLGVGHGGLVPDLLDDGVLHGGGVHVRGRGRRGLVAARMVGEKDGRSQSLESASEGWSLKLVQLGLRR